MFFFLLIALAAAYLLVVLRWQARFDEPKWNWEALPLDEVRFPPDFVWGVATSAHQVEGGCDNNNWSTWEADQDSRGRPRIARGQRSGAACEHWDRYAEDVELMKKLGVSAHRLSIEWSKIEPEPGRFEPSVIAHYHEVFAAHRDAGISVTVTLHHFTHPKWFEAKGGFAREENIDDFVRFCQRMFDEYRDEVEIWWTINEPEVVASMGYLTGIFPPGRRDVQQTGEVLRNLLEAHTAVYHALKQRPGGREARIGLVKNIFVMHPFRRWSLLDWLLARGADRLMNIRILEYLKTGTFELALPGLVRVRKHNPEARGAFDVIGLNYYSHLTLRANPFGRDWIEPALRPDEVPTEMPFTMYAEGLLETLRQVGELGVPVYVTENGTADAADIHRAEWIRRHLYALSRAMDEGIDVRGFYYWSLMDNFEWAEGFDKRFGLYEVDYATQARRLRAGAQPLMDAIRKSRGSESADPKPRARESS